VIPTEYEYERKGRTIDDDDDDINILKKNERMMTTEYEYWDWWEAKLFGAL